MTSRRTRSSTRLQLHRRRRPLSARARRRAERVLVAYLTTVWAGKLVWRGWRAAL